MNQQWLWNILPWDYSEDSYQFLTPKDSGPMIPSSPEPHEVQLTLKNFLKHF